MDPNKFLVCVRCFTYNHASYIVDAMSGFTMQQTDFPFVCTIVDDASTDGEQEVIRHYLEEHFDLSDTATVRNEETDDYVLTFAQHKSNKNCYFAVLYLKYNHYSIKKPKKPYCAEWNEQAKYIALCEGDDYWIHPQKLQMQVRYLSANPNALMCTHAFNTVTDSKRLLNTVNIIEKSGMLDAGLIIENIHCPQTATFLFNHSLDQSMPTFFKQIGVGDYPMRVFAAINGGVLYINEVMSNYRKYSSGSWTSVMVNDTKRYLSYVDRMVAFVKELDVFTKGLYHENIENRIDYCNWIVFIKKKKFCKAMQTRYYHSHNFKQKMELLIQYGTPKLWYVISKLYNRGS